MQEKFWLEEPSILFLDPVPIPMQDMNRAQKCNALSRLIILGGAGAYIAGYTRWLEVTAIGLIGVAIFYYSSKKEGFTVPITYNSPDMFQTVVPPLYAEEWQLPPPAYDIYNNTPEQGYELVENKVSEQMLMPPLAYPYGQYLSPTNMLPQDAEDLAMNSLGVKSAREYANSTFMRRDIAKREEMMRLYRKKIARRFRQEAYDTFSPYGSS